MSDDDDHEKLRRKNLQNFGYNNKDTVIIVIITNLAREINLNNKVLRRKQSFKKNLKKIFYKGRDCMNLFA